MGKYRIVAAKPKGLTSGANSQFKVYELKSQDQKSSWSLLGWKSIYDIAALMKAGHEVLTGKVEGSTLHAGEAVELELRIAHNGTKYKISDMPDS